MRGSESLSAKDATKSNILSTASLDGQCVHGKLPDSQPLPNHTPSRYTGSDTQTHTLRSNVQRMSKGSTTAVLVPHGAPLLEETVCSKSGRTAQGPRIPRI